MAATTASAPSTSTTWPLWPLEAAGWPDDRVVDAVGPERPTFVELVEADPPRRGQPGPDRAGARHRSCSATSKVLGAVLHDVLLTADEYRSMAAGLADSDAPATGTVEVSQWLAEHGDTLGVHYANELDLHFGGDARGRGGDGH